VPVPIAHAADEKGQALDQFLSVLRAVSPICAFRGASVRRPAGTFAGLTVYNQAC